MASSREASSAVLFSMTQYERKLFMEVLQKFSPLALGLLALVFAFYLIRRVGKADPGTERMREIAAYIHEGARAFLMAEYRILSLF